MILPTTFTVSVAVQFDGLTLTPVVVSDSQMVYVTVKSRWGILQWLRLHLLKLLP
jgi:hypothetical protein